MPLTIPDGGPYRPVTLLKHIVFIDGLARCGKSLLSPILASFKNVEIERVEQIFEFIGQLYGMGKIDLFAAISLLRQQADEFLLDSYLSRNTNFRWSDSSSVFRNPRPWRYLSRLFAREGAERVEALLAEPPIFQTHTHDQMAFIGVHFHAWPDELRVIEMRRHPADLVDSWWRRGWGTRFGKDPQALTICLHQDGEAVPYYARDWAEQYLRMAPMDRIIRIIHGVCLANRESYQNLPPERKWQIYVIRFEDFVTDPYTHTQEIARFLGTETSRVTPKAIRRQNCPRVLSRADQEERLKFIRAESGPESRVLIDELIDDQEMAWVS